MKIWLQSADALEGDPLFDDYRNALIKRSKEVARPGTTVTVHGVKVSSTILDRSHYIDGLNSQQIVNNAIQAEKEGYDAFALTCMLDPGHFELREVVDIPVVLPLEANCHVACMLGPKFALVGFTDAILRRQTDYVKGLGLGENLVPCPAFNVSLETLSQGFKDPKPVIKEVRKIAKIAAGNGADMLISLCGNLTMILVVNGVTEVEGLPFMDTVGTSIKTAEYLADLKKIGVDRAKRGLYNRLTKKELKDARKLYGVG